jgi:molybdopterin-binding protein
MAENCRDLSDVAKGGDGAKSEAVDPTGQILFLVARGADRAHGLCMTQSIRNRIPGTIREITSDPVVSEVVLDTTIGPVAAVITTRSLKELGLKVGDSVYGLVKATNVSIEKE